MNTYENIAILDASLSEEATDEAIKKITDKMEAAGAEILKVDKWGRRKMVYEINKHNKGFFVLFLFKSPGTLVSTMETYYKVTDTIVKYMFVRLEKKQEAAAMRALEAEAKAAEAAKAAPVEEAKAEEAKAATAVEEAKTEEAPAVEAEAKTETETQE